MASSPTAASRSSAWSCAGGDGAGQRPTLPREGTRRLIRALGGCVATADGTIGPLSSLRRLREAWPAILRGLPSMTDTGGQGPAAGVTGRPERILLADDDAAVRALLRTLMIGEGYAVTEAPNGRAALAALAEHGPFDLLVLDVRMPGRDGLEVTRRVRADPTTALTPVILVTGGGALEDKIAGLDAGATDFLTKPFEAPELLARVRAALRMKAAIDRLESTQGVLVALANAVEAKDPSTEHHCDRLGGLAMTLGRLARLDAEAVEAIGYGAALHDIGKIGVAETILRKPARLTDAEWAEIRRHPEIGARIVRPLRLGAIVAPVVRGHHERWDGHGYPDGLRHEQIPIGARIVALVDSFDAMTHERPYREGMPIDAALAELAREAGRQFDPALAALFIEHCAAFGAPDEAAAAGAFARGLVGAAVR